MTSTKLLPLFALVLALASPGCVDSLSEESRPCPCTDGWTCCASTQRCVADGTACPAQTPPEEETPPAKDVVPPVTPVLKAAIPGSPTSSATVTLDGTTEPGAAVALFTTADCSGAPVGTGTANAAGVFRIAVPPRANASTSFWARATDAAKNASHCSAEPLTVLHDDVAPGRPVLESLTPGPLSRTNTHPVLSGTAEPGSTVRLFSDAACTQALPFSATADAVGAFRVWASVEVDTTTAFHARALDAAGNASPCSTTSLGFTHDGTPPAPPELGAFGPYVTRAETDAPGTAEALSEVTLFAAAGCAGEPVATGATLADGTFTLRFQPRRNTANTLTARATDAAGNTSACSAERAFVHDDTPPRLPWALHTQPSSPSASRTPVLQGNTDAGATVRVYTSFDCSASSSSDVFTGVAGLGNTFGVQVQVRENTWTPLSVTATDAAGNVSACATSAPLFIHDSVPPPPPLLLTAGTPMPYSGPASYFSAFGMAEAGARIQLYDNPTCTGTPAMSTQASTPKSLSWGDFSWWSELPQPDASITYHATATDGVGNTSACSSTSVTVARTSGRGWRDEAQLSEARRPVLALNDAGQALAVWNTSTTSPIRVHATFSTPTGWTPSTQLSGEGSTTSEPAAALSHNGYAFATWVESTGTYWQTRARVLVPGQDWQPAQTLSNAGVSATLPTVAADAAGNALALWLEYAPSDSSTRVLWTARFTPAGGWERSQRLSVGTASIPHLAMSASGHAWAFWSGSREGGTEATWNSRYTPGRGWSTPEVMEIPVWSYSQRYLGLGVDDAGGVTVTWLTGGSGATVWARRFVPGQGWGLPSRLSSQEGALLSVPKLAVNARGEALVVWRNEASDVKQQSLWTARFTPETGWSGATLLQDGPGPFQTIGGPEQLWVGLDETGAGLVTFVRPRGTLLYGNTDGTATALWSTRFEPSSGWGVPRQVGMGTYYVSMKMNAKGEALVTWEAAPLSDRRTTSRWFR
jgi:hypothetical protein